MKFIGIIPARYSSTRFPGKPLADICGTSMIERVYRRASLELDDVIVATDDDRIFSAVVAFGGKVVMTSPDHRSGTDRCYEAFTTSGSDADVIINIQGDEPFIHPAQIATLKNIFLDNPSTDIGTLIRPFPADGCFSDLANPNSPKVVVADNGDALYFSRSVIPYLRGYEPSLWPSRHHYFTHVGMYAYRAPVLAEIVSLQRSPLEIAESLEQLRWLQAGFKIKTGITDVPTIGIDTPEDLEKARIFAAQNRL